MSGGVLGKQHTAIAQAAIAAQERAGDAHRFAVWRVFSKVIPTVHLMVLAKRWANAGF
jgi:hypothetical protein